MANNLTRINNNQISTASTGNAYLGINASTKVQGHTITGGLLANNLTYGSDLTVTGNLTVQGTTTAVNTVNTLISDPLIVLADGQTTGTPSVDIGYIGLRGSQDNIAVAWKEGDKEVVAAFTTTESGNVYSNTTFTITDYANFHSNDLTASGNLAISGTTSLAGNVISAITVEGNITATPGNYFLGDGSQLTGVTAASVNAANLTGNTLSSNVLYSSLTSVGTLTDLSVTGSTTSGNLLTGGEVSATGTATAGNISTAGYVSAQGTVTGGNLATGGNVSATGNITGANFSTSGASGNITGANNIIATTISGTANVIGGNILTGGYVSATGDVTGGNVYTGGKVSASGNVTAGAGSYFIGDGSQLTGVTAASVNAANLTGNTLSSNVLYSSLTSVGTLTDLSVTGSTTSGNLYTGGAVSATGTATAGNVSTAGYVSATGTVTGGNLATGGNVSATGNVTGGNVLTNGYVSAQGNVLGGNVITDYILSTDATTTTLTVNAATISLNPVGNVGLNSRWINNLADPTANQDAATKYYVDTVAQGLNAKQSVSAASITYLANVSGVTNVAYNNGTAGVGATLTITTTSQLSIDSIDLSTLAANARVLIKNEIATTGSNAAWNGIYVVTSTGTLSTVLTRSADFNQPAEMYSAFTFVTEGTINDNTGWVCTNNDTNPITIGTTPITFTQFSGAGSYTAGNALSLNGTQFNVNVDSTGNSTIGINGSNELYIPSGVILTTPNIGAATGTSVSVTGTVTGGDLATAGTVSATGNVTGGNVLTGGYVSANGDVTGGNLYTVGETSATGNVSGGNVLTGGYVTATGNVTGANVLTGGYVSATGTVTGGDIATSGNVSATGTVTGSDLYTGGNVSATGNVTGGNVLTGGYVSASGNITAGAGSYFIGDGSQLTGVAADSVNANALVGNTLSSNVLYSSLTSVGVLSDLSVTGTTTSGNLSTGGYVTATGNVTGGNVYTGGEVSASGTVTGGDLATGGNVSATGNVTGGNVLTGGYVSASGDVTGNNLYGSGELSVTGNITGGNISTSGSATLGNIVISGDDITDTNGRVNINTALDAVDFAVNGLTANVVYVNATTGTVSFGSDVQTTDSIVAFNSSNSVLMPVGNTAQRPAGVTGQMRFNTTLNTLEVYTNSTWVSVGQPDFTVITDQQFTGTGSQTVYTLSANATTAGTIVSINGVQQIPTTAYSVSDTTLTFTEAPEVGDLIDVRTLVTTTTVSGISNDTGSAQVNVESGVPNVLVTGGLVVDSGTGYIYGDGTYLTNVGGGNVTANKIVSGNSQVNIATPGGDVYIAVAGANVFDISTAQSTFTGNLNPFGNALYSLGNASNQWKSLYVSNNTIYIGGTAIATSAGQLTVSGNAVVTVGQTTTGSMSVTGTINGGNIATGGNVSATGTVTGASVVGGVITGTSVSVTGNITGAYISGNGSQLTGLPAGYTNANTAAFLAAFGSNTISTTGTITAGNITGSNLLTGGLISSTGNITGGNINATNHTGTNVSVTGTVTAASTVGGVITGSSASVSGTVTAASTVGGVITGSSASVSGTVTAASTVGGVITGTSTSVTGNVTGSNVNTGGTVSATGTITTGSNISAPSGYISVANGLYSTSAYGGTYVDGIVIDYVTGNGRISMGSADGLNIYNGATVANTIIASFNTTGSLTLGTTGTGNLNGGNILASGAVSATGQVRGANIVTAGFISATSTITTAGQLGASSVSATGDVQIGGNLSVTGNVNFTGNINQISGNSGQFFGNTTTGYGALYAGIPSGYTSLPSTVLQLASNANTYSQLEMQNINSGSSASSDYVVTADNGSDTTFYGDFGINSSTFSDTGNTIFSANDTYLYGVGSNANGPYSSVGANLLLGATNGQIKLFVGGQQSSNVVVAVSNIGINVTGRVSATGTVTAASTVGGVITGSSASVTGALSGASASVSGGVTAASVSGGVITGSSTSVTGTVTAASTVGGVITGSSTSVSGGVTAASVSGGVITGSSASVTGNVTGGNINTAGTAGILSVNSITHTGTTGVGNIGASGAAFNTVFAQATTALYADLAEKYTADAEYAPGTVLVFGGTAEVTVNAVDSDRRVAGVVSTDPGFIMNEGLDSEFVASVALTGRVPCFVIGPVKKGDLMVAAGLGRARAEADPKVGTVIGKALEDFDGAEGTIEVVVGRF